MSSPTEQLTAVPAYSGTYLLADVPIRIDSLYEEVQLMCQPYATTLPAQLTITTSALDIESESVSSIAQRQDDGLPPCQFPASYLETLAVYRKVATALLPLGVLLMHGSVVAVDGQAYMFSALSGTGKSTHVRLWRQLFGARAVMVNDDKPLVRITDDQVLVYGTPWDGKHHLSSNISVPLRAIVALHRGADNEIHAISAQEAFPMLFQQTFHTFDAMVTIQVMQRLSTLVAHVSLYSLHCNMDPSAASVAYEGMQ